MYLNPRFFVNIGDVTEADGEREEIGFVDSETPFVSLADAEALCALLHEHVDEGEMVVPLVVQDRSATSRRYGYKIVGAGPGDVESIVDQVVAMTEKLNELDVVDPDIPGWDERGKPLDSEI